VILVALGSLDHQGRQVIADQQVIQGQQVTQVNREQLVQLVVQGQRERVAQWATLAPLECLVHRASLDQQALSVTPVYLVIPDCLVILDSPDSLVGQVSKVQQVLQEV